MKPTHRSAFEPFSPLPPGEVGEQRETDEGLRPHHCNPHPKSVTRLSTSPNGRGKEAAFTLVELSIVLVIIGLMVGGILAGQSLYRLSQIRGVMTDLTDYASAVGKFRTEFRALPGDISTATSYWGIAGGTGSDTTCYSTDESTGTATCNGNGNNALDWTNPGSGVSDATEMYLAWKHMINAGVIAGPALTGRTANTGGYGIVGGTNTPTGKIDGSAYLVTTVISCVSGSASYYDGCYPLVLLAAGSAPAGFWGTTNITPEEMYGIDKKMDDGMPGYGQVRAFKSDASCSSAADTYILTGTSKACRIIFGVEPITANQ